MARSTAPVITGNQLKRLTEDGNTTTTGGDLDVRNGADSFLSFETLEGLYGTFSMSADGAWTYVLDNTREATQALAAGETVYDWFYAQTSDLSLGAGVVVQIRGAADEVATTTVELGLVGIPDSGV